MSLSLSFLFFVPSTECNLTNKKMALFLFYILLCFFIWSHFLKETVEHSLDRCVVLRVVVIMCHQRGDTTMLSHTVSMCLGPGAQRAWHNETCHSLYIINSLLARTFRPEHTHEHCTEPFNYFECFCHLQTLVFQLATSTSQLWVCLLVIDTIRLLTGTGL